MSIQETMKRTASEANALKRNNTGERKRKSAPATKHRIKAAPLPLLLAPDAADASDEQSENTPPKNRMISPELEMERHRHEDQRRARQEDHLAEHRAVSDHLKQIDHHLRRWTATQQEASLIIREEVAAQLEPIVKGVKVVSEELSREHVMMRGDLLHSNGIWKNTELIAKHCQWTVAQFEQHLTEYQKIITVSLRRKIRRAVFASTMMAVLMNGYCIYYQLSLNHQTQADAARWRAVPQVLNPQLTRKLEQAVAAKMAEQEQGTTSMEETTSGR